MLHENTHGPSMVLPFFSILYRSDLHSKDEILEILEAQIGSGINYEHPYVPMKDYYSKEMGPIEKLERFLYTSTTLNHRDNLVKLKLWSMEFERRKCLKGKRTINLDPGLIALENLQLATSKPFSHRIYLSQNIFSELTYITEKQGFRALDWTYPDYKNTQVIEFFEWCRNYLIVKISEKSYPL